MQSCDAFELPYAACFRAVSANCAAAPARLSRGTWRRLGRRGNFCTRGRRTPGGRRRNQCSEGPRLGAGLRTPVKRPERRQGPHQRLRGLRLHAQPISRSILTGGCSGASPVRAERPGTAFLRPAHTPASSLKPLDSARREQGGRPLASCAVRRLPVLFFWRHS